MYKNHEKGLEVDRSRNILPSVIILDYIYSDLYKKVDDQKNNSLRLIKEFLETIYIPDAKIPTYVSLEYLSDKKI
jgi:hypothetical protein